jgi:hypothetical protein
MVQPSNAPRAFTHVRRQHSVHPNNVGLEYHVNPDLLLISEDRLRTGEGKHGLADLGSRGRSACYGAVRWSLNDQQREQQHG